MLPNLLHVPIVQLPHGKDLPLPSHATSLSAGVDLMAAIEESISLLPLKRLLIPTGISLAIPEGYEAQIRSRSGLALKFGLSVLNSPATIDADYRGELKVILCNFGEEPFFIERGMRIAQLVIASYMRVNWEPKASHEEEGRGGGFGSTGLSSFGTAVREG